MDSFSFSVILSPNQVVQPYGKARNHKTIPHIIGLNSIAEAGQKLPIETKPGNHVIFL